LSSAPSDRLVDSPPREIRSEELRGLEPVRQLKGRNRSKADILVYSHEGVEIAVKDYTPRSWLVRQTLGRWLIRRETAAYRACSGIPGIPTFLGRLGPFTLATRWISARPLAQIPDERIDGACFTRLAEILDALHARGIALVDLHHRDVLVSETGTVHLVDLAMAWRAGQRGGLLGRAIFARLCDADRVALARMRARSAGRDPADAVNEVGERAARWHRRSRQLKRLLSGSTKRTRADMTRRNRALGIARIALTFLFLGLILLFARPTPFGVSCGFIIAAAGEALRTWAAGYLNKTVELTTAGPYRYTRNPLYLGRLLIFTGFCFMAPLPHYLHWLVLAIGYTVFFGYYLRRKERIEPARLRATHGDAYERYFDAIPALFPTLLPYAEISPAGWSSRRMLHNREHWMIVGLLLAALLLLWRAYHLEATFL